MVIKEKKQLLSTCTDSLLELQQYTEVLEQAGYTKDTIENWMPTTVLGTVQLLYNASLKAHKSNELPWVMQYSQINFAKKISGTILETLLEAMVNSQRYQRVMPGNPEHCYHRGDYGIPDLEMGSPDKILKLPDGRMMLVNIKSSADPKTLITVNKANTSNIFAWREDLDDRDPSHPFAKAKVMFVSNVRAMDTVIRGTKCSIHGAAGPGSLSQLLDNKNSIQFWRDFWNTLWDTVKNNHVPISNNFDGLYKDQIKKVFDPVHLSTSQQLTVTAACGIGKTIIARELVLADYKEYNISGRGIYGISFPRLALGSQHNDTFAELQTFATLVNASANNYSHHFKPGENLSLNTATTDIKKLARTLIDYVYGSQSIPLLILNTDKGLPRLMKAFEMIKSGEVSIKKDANPNWTYKKVIKLCRQFHHDECHNLVPSTELADRKTKTFKKQLVKSLLYFNSVFNKSVYWTATKKINGGDYDMNNIKIYGTVEAEYSFADAIKNGRILPSYVRIITLSDSDFVGIEKILTNSKEENEDLTFLIKAITDHKQWCDDMDLDCQIMFFSKGTKILPAFKEALEKVFATENIYVDYVTAETNQKDRQTKFTTYSNSKFSVLMNYDIIAEGIDIPSTTAVVIGRGMNDIKIVQAASRGIRLLDADRLAFKQGKIKSGDTTGWLKPYSWVYLFENEAVAEDSLRTTKVEDILTELENHNMTYDFDVLKTKVSGGSKLPEPDPDTDEVEKINALEKLLKIKLDKRLVMKEVLENIKKLDTSNDNYILEGLKLCK